MKRYHLTKAEMETIVNYDEELPTATIYTFDQRMIHKLSELAKKYPDQFILKQKGPDRSVSYEFPKKCFGIRPPYSEKRRKEQIRKAQTDGSPFAEQEDV